MGPNLWGVGGRKAGSTAFSYSPAMKAAKINWTRANLMAFVADPRKVVPGTKMAYAGEKNPAKTTEIVNYLLALK